MTTSRDFCFWLQGYFELCPNQPINAEQASLIKAHLGLVFKHEIDPSMGDAKHQAALDAIHDTAVPDHSVPLRPPHRPDGMKMRC